MPAEATRGTSRSPCSSRWLGTFCCGPSACSPQGRSRGSPEKSERWEDQKHIREVLRETDTSRDSWFPRKLRNTSNRDKNLQLIANLSSQESGKLRLYEAREKQTRTASLKRRRRALHSPPSTLKTINWDSCIQNISGPIDPGQ